MAIYAYLSSIVPQLISSLPDVFDCDEGSKTLVQLACQIIKRHHYRRRFVSKHQIQSAVVSPRKRFVVSVTVVFIFLGKFLGIELMGLPYSQPEPLCKKNEKRRRIEKKTISLVSHSTVMNLMKSQSRRLKLNLLSPDFH